MQRSMKTRMKAICLLVCFVVSTAAMFNPGDTYADCRNARTNGNNCNGADSSDGFRTIDGTCNNLQNSAWGATNVPLIRLIRAQYAANQDTPRGFPDTPSVPTAAEVSARVFRIPQEMQANEDGLSALFTIFGQFLDHDISISPHGSCSVEDCEYSESFNYPCFPIRLCSSEIPCRSFARATPVCPPTQGSRGVREQINELTAFIDGSQVYGSDEKLADRLRDQDQPGKLRVGPGNMLPKDEASEDPCKDKAGCFLAGDVRSNENMLLTSMHTIWVRQHNLIVDGLKKVNPTWSSNRLYQNARKIVGAMLQRIVYEEFLPPLVDLPQYSGYKKSVNPSIANGFSTAAFRFGHSLVQDSYAQLDNNFDQIKPNVELRDMFFNSQIIRDDGIENSVYGMVGNFSMNIDTTFSVALLRKLFIESGGRGRADLTALNIQRGRDHGIPTYGAWRRFCKLSGLRNFDDLNGKMAQESIDGFKKVFDHPNDIDLFAAGIAENHVQGKGLGPTFSCILKNQFERLREGDRFFYLNKDVFTASQRQQIQKVTMAKVLCDTLKGVVSMQREAFLVPKGSTRRVACTSIEGIDLSPWETKN